MPINENKESSLLNALASFTPFYSSTSITIGTNTPNTNKIVAILVGGGGGGGASSPDNTSGGAGGGGETSIYFVPVSLGQVLDLTIGSGGGGGPSNTAPGFDGNVTALTSNSVLSLHAAEGRGGLGGVSNGGGGGTMDHSSDFGYISATYFHGRGGGAGNSAYGPASARGPVGGTASFWGGSAGIGGGASNGLNGSDIGNGGGGASNGNLEDGSTRGGGDGAPGAIFIAFL